MADTKIRVDSDIVNSTANKLDDLNSQLDTAFEEVNKVFVNISHAWENACRDKVISIYNLKAKKVIKEEHDSVKKFADWLRNGVSIGYTEVEDSNIKLAAEFME